MNVIKTLDVCCPAAFQKNCPYANTHRPYMTGQISPHPCHNSFRARRVL